MAAGIVEWLGRHGREPGGGLIVAAAPGAAPHHALALVTGDHPVPGPRSLAASRAIEATIARMPTDADVHVAISGGTTSLVAAPFEAVTLDAMHRAFTELLASGVSITEMNAARRKLTRWSDGRLATALAPRRTLVWLMSDVPGDDPRVIGSGPCTPWDGSTLPGVSARLVASNAEALRAAAEAARHEGASVECVTPNLQGEARDAGRAIVRTVLDAGDDARQRVWLWGGETTVTIRGDHGRGGRSQELALAAAEMLCQAPAHVTLLAAGTDGRDGPTDAAGAIVTPRTWSVITTAGIDPAESLASHDAYRALDSAGALLRTGPTGTNVMDLVIVATAPS